MSNEITLRVALQIKDKAGRPQYQSTPTAFLLDTAGAFKGPVPGAFTASVFGTDVDLSQLETPGEFIVKNLDSTNYVEIGVRVPALSIFVPFGEIPPGQLREFRFSRNLLQDYSNTGTGTDSEVNFLHVKANGADCSVSLEAFEA